MMTKTPKEKMNRAFSKATVLIPPDVFRTAVGFASGKNGSQPSISY